MLELSFHKKASLSLTAAAATWGFATVLSKRAVEEIQPLALLSIQLAVSVALLGLALLARRQRIGWSNEIRQLAALGVLNPGLSYALGLLGLAQITASLSVLLWAIEPVLILVLARQLLKEPITTPVAIGSLVALIGALLVVFEAGSTGTWIGIALTLGGVAACAVYTVVSRRTITSEPTLAVVAVQQVSALLFALVLLGIYTIITQPTDLSHVTFAGWASAIASGALYYAVAFWFYIAGLRRVSATEAGTFLNLIPIFGVAAGHLFLAERLSGRQWIGAVLIVISVGAISRSYGRGREMLTSRRLA